MNKEIEIKQWYNKKYAATTACRRRPPDAYPVLLDYLNVDSGKLLDIGCGAGMFLRAASGRGLETYGVDISEEAVKIAQDYSRNSCVTVGSALDLKFSNNIFDYVTCLGVLEHFLDMDKGLQEMKRVGREDCKFCVVVPNVHFVGWLFRGKQGTEQRDIVERLLSLEQWRQLFVKNRFLVTAIHKDMWFMKFHITSLKGRLKRFFAKLVWYIIPLQWDYQFVFILKNYNPL